jgi:uncharacterized protein YeaO (DUF488 family)
MIRVKRIYEPAEEKDGFRILVDRLWPRGVSKERAKVDLWLKDIAPSDELRKWFHHEQADWQEFQSRYEKELQAKKELLSKIKDLESEKQIVTLLYSARDELHNQAIVLNKILEGAKSKPKR